MFKFAADHISEDLPTIGRVSQENFVNKVIKTREIKYGLNTNLISDGAHTFGQLYHERATWFALFMNNYMDLTSVPKAAELNLYGWKSWFHNDGTMYDGYFIVGVTDKKTGKMFTYHYYKEYWDFFDVDELPTAPYWDKSLDVSIDDLAFFFVPNYRKMEEMNNEKEENDCRN